MADKPNFLSFRSDEILAKWIKAYAARRKMSVSDIMREAMLEYKARKDSEDELGLGEDFEILRSEVGHMFRVAKTDNGVLLEKIQPGVVELK